MSQGQIGRWHNQHFVTYWVLSALSFCSSLYIIIAIKLSGKYSRGRQRDHYQNFFWVAVSLLGLNLRIWLELLLEAGAFEGSEEKWCIASATMAVFFTLACSMWYFIVGFSLHLTVMAMRSGQRGLDKRSGQFHHVLTWSVALFGAVFEVLNNALSVDSTQGLCWITPPNSVSKIAAMRLVVLLPMLISLGFGAIVVFSTLCLLSHSQVPRNKKQLIYRVITILLVFMGSWVWFLIYQAWNISTEPPPFLLYLSTLGPAGGGIWNLMVCVVDPVLRNTILLHPCSKCSSGASKFLGRTRQSLRKRGDLDITATAAHQHTFGDGSYGAVTKDAGNTHTSIHDGFIGSEVEHGHSINSDDSDDEGRAGKQRNREAALH